ncbi:MAG: UDP-3-O-(3-hydroxymyristoyl)glucosamine N-acyltransferase [Lentimicrobiaceae bacterium]|nr:UDP-3-O-(3-hydroxymyristoyl)glucosamine N-acyltransferase [Lentimicrobiaceae bacterium]MCB9023501.1 UDP-3-O-(3-hydroxymyristoyl)glucosamine N-acyltransferase [Lentimicrobiaceae bacterium]MCO5267010.1 UDP-3-O-(3-hydroxymyristoyl)glucosamine N-acyltransferase [Lentimicrobium sp.]
MKLSPAFTLSSISQLIDAKYAGDPEFIISGLNEIHMVEAGDLTFVDHPKYYDKALNSKATTIIINKEVPCPAGKALIFHSDPFAAYVSLVKRFRPFEPATASISPSAVIGEGTIIQPNAFIGNHVTIGRNCIIHANASIYDHCVLGDNVIIHSNSVIGADAYYFQRKPEGYRKFESCGRTVISDNVEVGALCTIDKGVSGDTFIGKGTKFDNHVQVGHDTYIGNNCLIGSHCAIAGVTRIEDDVILWGKVVINKDLVIGKGAIILATSGVGKSLEGGKTYFGIPADEARKKWREIAALRQLPSIIGSLNSVE